MHHKPYESNNYRQIIKVDNIGFCREIKRLKDNKWLEGLLYLGNNILPGVVPEKCPVIGVRRIAFTDPSHFNFLFLSIEISNRERIISLL
jgi:hypothetical protein